MGIKTRFMLHKLDNFRTNFNLIKDEEEKVEGKIPKL